MKTFGDDGYKLFVSYLEVFLGGVTFRGFQSGFGFGPDLILFDYDGTGATLAISVDTMYLTPDAARAVVQRKVMASKAAFSAAV